VSFHSSECAWGGADHETVDMDAFLARFKNHEQSGVPAGAGVETDTGARFDLARMRRLLSVLGNPQKGYPMIHVAGTKGKGSVVSLLASILRTAGLNVGTYKSPHVRSVSERIVCGPFPESERNGDTVSPSGLDVSAAEAVAKFLVEHETDQLTYFELLTAFAFLEFKKNKVDVAVVEVGVGGSTDATNVFESKDLAAAVLTALGDDHLDALGGSLGSVAAAKVRVGPFTSTGDCYIRHNKCTFDCPWSTTLLVIFTSTGNCYKPTLADSRLTLSFINLSRE
jgi:hypothetical protein